MRKRAEEEMTLIIAQSHKVAMDKVLGNTKGFWASILKPLLLKILKEFLLEFAQDFLNSVKKSDTIEVVEK